MFNWRDGVRPNRTPSTNLVSSEALECELIYEGQIHLTCVVQVQG